MGTSFVLVMGSLALAAGDPAAEFKAELKRLKGTWVMVTYERNGDVRPQSRTLWVFDGEKATVHHQTRPVQADAPMGAGRLTRPSTWTARRWPASTPRW